MKYEDYIEIQEFPYLYKMKLLEDRLREYQSKYKRQLEDEQDKIETKIIRTELPPLLERFMVWCRNANICEVATPCDHLYCIFKLKDGKSDPLNIVYGASNCKQFQITTITNNWMTAMHVADYASTTLNRFEQPD